MLRRLFGTQIVVALLLVGVLAHSVGAAPARRIVIWDKSEYIPAYNRIMNERIREWGQANGVDVVYVVIPPRELITKLMAAVESGDVPDIATVEVGMVLQLAGMGATLPTDQLMKTIEQEQNTKFVEAAYDLVSVDGVPYGVPSALFPAGLYYRKDLFQAAAVAAPKTWDEFLIAAQKTTNPRTNVFGAGLPMGRSGGGDAEGFIRSVIWGNGGSIFANDGHTVVVDSDRNVESVRWTADLWRKHKVVPPGSLAWDDNGNNNAYLSGTVAMVINSGSIWANMRDTNHPLFEKSGVVPIPAGSTGRAFNVGGGNTFVVFKKGHPDLASSLIRYLFDKDFYGSLVERMSPMWSPTLMGLESRPFFQQPDNRAWLEAGRLNVNVGYPGPATPWAGEVMSSQVMVSAIQSVILYNTPEKTALQEARKRIEEIVAKYQK